MKKTLLILALVGAAAAQTPNYPVIYSPAVGGPVPNPAYQPQNAAQRPAGAQLPANPYRYSGDLLIGYGYLAVPNSKYATDVVTCTLEGAYNFTPQHAATLSLGLAGGGETNDYWVYDPNHHESYPFTDSFDRTSFTVMAGYRFTHPLTRSVSLQLGAKCGLDVQELDIKYGKGWSAYPYKYRGTKSDTSVGMAYAGYANLLFHVAKNADLVLGYQFSGSTAKPSPSSDDPQWPRHNISTLRWHEVHAGVIFHF